MAAVGKLVADGVEGRTVATAILDNQFLAVVKTWWMGVVWFLSGGAVATGYG